MAEISSEWRPENLQAASPAWKYQGGHSYYMVTSFPQENWVKAIWSFGSILWTCTASLLLHSFDYKIITKLAQICWKVRQRICIHILKPSHNLRQSYNTSRRIWFLMKNILPAKALVSKYGKLDLQFFNSVILPHWWFLLAQV